MRKRFKRMWERFKRDFKERFYNYETAKGLYLFPAGLMLIYLSIYHVEYVIQGAGALTGIYCLYEGLRKILVNRIKQELKKKELVESHVD